MHCFSVLFEALEQLLFERFLFSRGDDALLMSPDESRDTLGHLFRSPDIESLQQAINNACKLELVQSVKTAQVWVSYINHI